jgi:hypothetical protein
LALLAWACLALGCTTAVDPLAGPDAFRRDASVDASVQQGDSGAGADAGWRDASLAGADAATASSDAAFEPCPALPIPATCNGRTVVYREWGPEAKGDGAYFADQAPWRLGFNRLHGEIWIVKIALEDNSYLGTVSAYGDNVGGTAWITDQPCDAAFAVDHKLVAYGNHGGGSIDFVVVQSDADAQKIANDPTLKAQLGAMPQVFGGRCYYAEFENTDWPTGPVTADFFATTADSCGNDTDPSCYYLAFDFGHLLHDPTSGDLFQGRVIQGLTH